MSCVHPPTEYCGRCLPDPNDNCSHQGFDDLFSKLCLQKPVFPCPLADQDVAAIAFYIHKMQQQDRRLRAAITALIDTFQHAIVNCENRGKGGQHVSYHGDFASISPSVVSTMKRWIRDFQDALRGIWPACPKCGEPACQATCT